MQIKYQEAEKQEQSICNEFSSHLIRIGDCLLINHPKKPTTRLVLVSSTKYVSPKFATHWGEVRTNQEQKYFVVFSTGLSLAGLLAAVSQCAQGLRKPFPVRVGTEFKHSRNTTKTLICLFPLILSWVCGGAPKSYSDI